MNIGLFGGSFDPVHRAHLALARTALRELPLDQLWWLPASQPWQKPGRLAPAEDRAAMLALAIGDAVEGDPRYRLERCELDRGGASYTIDTIHELRQREPEHRWTLLIGQDQHAGLHTWHRWRELLAQVTLAVAGRPGVSPRVDPEVAAFGHLDLAMPPMEVSSTLLRERLAAGLGVDDLVPAPVASYIESHGLYRPGAGSPVSNQATLRS